MRFTKVDVQFVEYCFDIQRSYAHPADYSRIDRMLARIRKLIKPRDKKRAMKRKRLS